MDIVSKENIASDLRKIGITRGDKLIVHSSLKSIGYVDGGADTVIDMLMETVGEDGLLMMPTFTYSYELRVGALPYNKKKTPSETGLVTNAFWRRENVKRSEHPTHSVAVYGKDAAQFVNDHDEHFPPFDEGTPIHRLAMNDGYILLIGVGHESNSTIHAAEFMADLPFIDIKNRESYGSKYIIERDNQSIEKIALCKKLSGCSHGFGKVETLDRIINAQKEGYIGRARCKLIKGQEILDALVPVLREKPDFLLCSSKTCEGCSKRRKRLEEVQGRARKGYPGNS